LNGGQLDSWPLHETVGCIVRLEERLDLGAQSDVVATGLVQVAGTFVGRHLHSTFKDFAFSSRLFTRHGAPPSNNARSAEKTPATFSGF
jgi:hypothetical protein